MLTIIRMSVKISGTQCWKKAWRILDLQDVLKTKLAKKILCKLFNDYEGAGG